MQKVKPNVNKSDRKNMSTRVLIGEKFGWSKKFQWIDTIIVLTLKMQNFNVKY